MVDLSPTRRNIYEEGVDFSALALQSHSFSSFLKPNGQLDFSNPKAVKELTQSLLKRDFALEIDLPDDRLCPPKVPNRLNYILWIQDLLDLTSDDYRQCYDPERDVIGLDIGTGASCIYPLLGCALRPKWIFAATDIDDESLEYARKNITSNKLKSRIKPIKTTLEGPLIPLEEIGMESLDFTMCNPPFYKSKEEMLASASAKSRPPFSACTGALVEMVTPGGEIAFTKRLLAESLMHQERIQWYTTMLGKHSSVLEFLPLLLSSGVTNWAVTEFVQGSHTRRWGVAWSFVDRRPPSEVSRKVDGVPKRLLPFPPEFTFVVKGASIERAIVYVDALMTELDIPWRYKSQIGVGLGFAAKNVWARGARRKAMRGDEEEMEPATLKDAKLVFKIHLKAASNVVGAEIKACWLKGEDVVLWESFCAMLKDKLEKTVANV